MFGLVVPRRRPLFGAVGPRSGSRWSARSAARTNDLDAGEVGRMLIGLTAREGVGCFKSCAASARWGCLRGVGVPAPRLI
jgi:hypothetical protein